MSFVLFNVSQCVGPHGDTTRENQRGTFVSFIIDLT